MPVAVAVVVRYIIMAVIQAGLWFLVEKTVLPALNKVIVEVMEKFGVDEETAEDIVANEIITFAEQVGIFAFAMKSKMPIKIAERLGFTTKGFSKRLLPESLLKRFPSLAKAPPVGTAAATSHVEEIAKATSQTKGLSLNIVKDSLNWILKIGGFTVGTLYMIAQFIDFGNWNSGAYQKTFQAVLSKFGLSPDAKMPQSSVLSKDVWLKVYNTYREAGATSINDPFKNEVVPFTRENLIDLVDKIASTILLEGGSTSVKNVLGATTALITYSGNVAKPAVDGGGGGTSATVAGGSSAGASSTGVKVFTGILSSGVVGEGLTFTPRQDDLIENITELQQAINNNVAPYLQSLLGRITYEVKIVSSVVVGGIRRYGTTTQIQVGQNKNGTAKMKTVTNKFALIELYLVKEGGSRTKLTSIVLGPTNAVNFQPTTEQLATLATTVSKDIVTTNTDEIAAVASNTPTQNVAPGASSAQTTNTASQQSSQVPSKTFSALGGTFNLYTPDGIDTYVYAISRGYTQPIPGYYPTVPFRGVNFDVTNEVMRNAFKAVLQGTMLIEQVQQSSTGQGSSATIGTGTQEAQESAAQQGSSTGTNWQIPMALPASNLPAAALSASTLSEFYAAMGWAWQSVAERGIKYQELGLGQAAFYTGTAEQNTKLLQRLKQG